MSRRIDPFAATRDFPGGVICTVGIGRILTGLPGRGQAVPAPHATALDARPRHTLTWRMTLRSARGLSCAAVLMAVLCVSCSMKQTIVIRSDGSGTLAMHVEAARLLHEYVARLSEVSDKPVLGPGGAFFDAESIRKDFESRPGVTVTKAATPSNDALDLELTFNSIQDVFAQDPSLKNTAALAYSESGGKKTIRLHLDRSNYPQLARTFPLLASPA